MRDAASGGHQVHGPGLDLQRVALAVAVHDAAVEQVGHGREPDMRMRAHVDALPGDELHWPHLVEEAERADLLAAAVRQRAPHRESTEVAGARHDHDSSASHECLSPSTGSCEGIQLMGGCFAACDYVSGKRSGGDGVIPIVVAGGVRRGPRSGFKSLSRLGRNGGARNDGGGWVSWPPMPSS